MDFDEILDQYEKPIFNLIFRLIGDREEAADLTQDTFLAAYRSLGAFRGDSSVHTWLYRIAVNKCKNKLKEIDRRRGIDGGSLDADYESLGPAAWDASRQPTPQVALERKELRERIERAITELPGDYRIVAVLRDLQGLSYEQIAQIADVSLDVVRTRIARARQMLRRKLGPYLDV
jgi:RNA polymerase sigma-70 factor (ECF subfamily)